jgi:hypothetical protein
MRTVLAVFAGLLMTTGCDRPDTPPAVAPTPGAADAPAIPPPADGSILTFVDAAGASAATLSCTPDELRIVAPGFQPIASEDRLSIGTAGEAFVLVADLAAPGPGVTASGAPDPDLLDRLAQGEALFAMYGQQSVGPLTAASPAALQAMISACRRP